MIEWITEAIKWAIDGLKDTALDLLLALLGTIGTLIPAEWHSGIETGITWLGYIDTWVPLSTGIQLYVAFYTTKGGLLAVKYILKVIPGIWG